MDELTRLQHISYLLFRLVTHIVGPERLIQLRRSVTNLKNNFTELYDSLLDFRTSRYISGSYGEGYRFSSSDKDFMFVERYVIVTDHRIPNNYSDDMTVLIMETEQCRPGYALLRLLHASTSRAELITQSSVQFQNRMYVSSTLWKETTPKIIPGGYIHGPCDSGIISETEVDFAVCFRGDTWPESALCCINRLRRAGWPGDTVIRNILTKGCHFAAIGAKGSDYEDKEWRISFVVAEKTLIQNMNHYQFLCYGLLKLFLKEALENRESGELLCSYFLKTAVFWEICNDRTTWSSTTLLHCFWACFRRLIGWVYNGYCPNFFIPENNMFYGKIQGRARSDLLDHLMTLYNEGYNCLLRCPSLPALRGFIDTINQPNVQNVDIRVTSDTELYPQSYFNTGIIKDILYENPARVSICSSMRKVHSLLQSLSFLTDHSNELQRLTLGVWERCAKQCVVVRHSLQENITYSIGNKGMYRYVNALRKLRSQPFDLLSHHLLTAVQLYRCGLYHNAVKVSLHAKRKLQKPNVMYGWSLDWNKYRAAGGDHTPLVTMITKIVANTFGLTIDICVPELRMEHQAIDMIANPLFFPPLVMINFLLYLSHSRLQQTSEAERILQELTMLLASEGEHHIRRIHRAISWTILGICQERSGELTNAHQSYIKALDDRDNLFKEATRERIENVMMKIRNE